MCMFVPADTLELELQVVVTTKCENCERVF